MRNKFPKLFIAGLTVLALTFSSCAKEGCTDPDSVNYDPKATQSDGTCRFEGRIVFWYDATAAKGLRDDDATSLLFYVDGKLVGSTSTSVWWNSAPDCGSTGSITVTKNLGSLKTGSASYSVKDQTGFEYWQGTLDFKANTCTSWELVW
jgi:hypothetical protein